MSNSNIARINPNQINATERNILENKLALQLTFPAWEYGNLDKETGLPTQKQVFVSCKLVTEVNPDDKTALRFSFLTSQSIKIDSRVVDATSGKYIKVTSETYLPALVYDFSYNFELTVTSHSNLLFAKGGNLQKFPDISRRDELARLVECMIDDGKIEFIKTYIDSKGIERVLHAYDDTVLLLIALKQHCNLKQNNAKELSETNTSYQQIKPELVMSAFNEAYQKSLESSVTLPNTVLDNYNRYAANKLKELKAASDKSKKKTESENVVNNATTV